MAFATCSDLPAAQVQAGIELLETRVRVRDFVRGLMSRGQFLDADVSELRLRTFGLQAKVALARNALGPARDHLAVHCERKFAVTAFDPVMVPFTGRIRTPFAGQTAHPAFRMWP